MFFNVLAVLTNVNIFFLLGFFLVLAALAAAPSIVVLLFRLPIMLLMLCITSIQKLCKRLNKQDDSQMTTEEEPPANACRCQFEKKAARTVEAPDVIYMTAASKAPRSASSQSAMICLHGAPISYANDRAYQQHCYRHGTTSADWHQAKGQLDHVGNSSLARREVSPVGSR